MPVKRRIALMSIKPEYGYRIMRGIKKFELRRYSVEGRIKQGDIVFLYFSYPVKALACMFVAGQVYEGTKEELQNIASKLKNTGLEDKDWKYLEDRKVGMMIEVKKPRRIRKIPLDTLRKKFNFNPPRSYHIVKRNEPIYRLLASFT